MNSGKILLGLLAGLAAGATFGILLAPDKGTKMRKKISYKGEDYLDTLKTKFEDFLSMATNELEKVKKESKNLVENGKSKIAVVKDEIKNEVGKKIPTRS